MRSFKYTNSKGDSINIGPNSVPTTLGDNLGSYWNANTLPDYPDNPSGTAYFQDAWATTDSWSAVSSTFTVGSGKGTLTTSAAYGSRIERSGMTIPASSTVKIRARRLTGTQTGMRIDYYASSAWSSLSQVNKSSPTDWNIYQFDLPATSGITGIRIIIDNSGEVWEIDWVYIGDGIYSTKLIDISGNWNFLNVYGCTPVAGFAGKALSFNGKSYLRSEKVLDYIPDVLRLHIRLPNGMAQPTTTRGFYNYKTTGTIGCFNIYRSANTDHLAIIYGNASSALQLVASSIFAGYASTRIDIAVEFNWTASDVPLSDGTTLPAYTVRVYRNGVVFANLLMTAPIKPVAGDYLYVGCYQGSTYYLNVPAEGFIIGSGALTAAEHWALYSNYSAPFKATNETSYGIVESVEGIDYAESDLQTTKAPYQDGKTYLDTLLSSRDITIEGIIPVATAIDTINANRKAMLDVLNAKYGTGTLDYYYGLNTIQHKVLKNVTVDSVRFANRVMPEPTQRYQITFTAHDPYFYDPTLSPYAIEILSGNSATLTVGGENNTPCFIRIYGAATNPTITNTTTGETLSLTYSLAGGSYIDIDTTFGNKSVKLNGSTNLIGYVDLTSTFFQLSPSSTVLSYSGGGYIIVTWYNRYIGV